MMIDINELAEVKGIGQKTLQRVREHINYKDELKQDRNVNLQVDELETNVIHNTDNIKGIRQLIPDNSIDLTVTSPPYDDLRDYEDYDFNFEAVARELYRVTKDGGVVVWVVGDETKEFCESLSSFKQALYFVEEIGFKLLDTMIYKKKSYPPAYPYLRRYANTFEYMFVLIKGKKPKTFNELRTKKAKSSIGNGRTASFRQKDGSLLTKEYDDSKKTKAKTNVWEYLVGNHSNKEDELKFNHPATFPNELAEDHIKSWSDEGDVVLDPFIGSGTTAKIAKKLNREYIGFEISKKYCEIARQRIDKV